jgi:hypothetical protein
MSFEALETSFETLEADLRRVIVVFRRILKRVILVFRRVGVWRDPCLGLVGVGPARPRQKWRLHVLEYRMPKKKNQKIMLQYRMPSHYCLLVFYR